MTGIMLFLLHPTNLWVHLGLSLLVDLTLYLKEVGSMNSTSVRSWFVTLKQVIASEGLHWPYRQSLLMSP